MADRNRNTLHLSDARELTPPVNPVEAMRRQLATAMFGSITEQDVLDMMTKLKQMGLGGDLKAMKMFFDLTVSLEKSAKQEEAHANQVAEALRDLVDEIRITRATADGPKSRPKQLAANGVNGHHDDDDE